MHKKDNVGTCELCDKETELFTVGEIEICEDCIRENYVACDHCNEYYTKEDTIVYHLKNSKVYCEDCAIYALNFSGLADDDIDHIDYPEGFEEEDEE